MALTFYEKNLTKLVIFFKKKIMTICLYGRNNKIDLDK